MKPIAKSKSASPSAKTVSTTGEFFDDGQLELVRDKECRGNLALVWSVQPGNTVKQFERNGHVYVPAQDESLQKMRLPTSELAYGSTGELFDEVEQVLLTHTGLTKEQAKLVTYFVFATHFLECLQSAPCLLIGGLADAHAIQLLTVLSCLCRHPMRFSGLHSVRASSLVGTSRCWCGRLLAVRKSLVFSRGRWRVISFRLGKDASRSRSQPKQSTTDLITRRAPERDLVST